uniref:ATP synthase subunit delta, chloroplastic n=1 Tax=Boldia erythrosiphon TaxID=74908 RepID=A0A1Y9TLX4_9RHOD|nr:ATP synthase CF1 subunit delta [Boldia erythrosiphon]ARO90616.1 ATP synthase CF1 subunit delta [Boldia erythrosiphon]
MSNKNLTAKIAQPYAEAFLEVVKASSCVNKNVDAALQVINHSQELKSFINNPILSSNLKKNILKKIFFSDLDRLSMNFFLVLVDKGRINIIQIILEKYLELGYKISSIIIAEVLTSIPFTPSQHDLLIDKIKIMTGSKQVRLNINIKPELIGGFTIQIGSKIIDRSLQGQLKQIASHLESDSYLL